MTAKDQKNKLFELIESLELSKLGEAAMKAQAIMTIEDYCREQREICAKVEDMIRAGYIDRDKDGNELSHVSRDYCDSEQVLNAPMPEL